MRGASCWSDHYLVRVKLRFAFQKVASKRAGRRKPLAVHHFAFESARVKYQEVLAKKFSNIEDDSEVTAGSCWSVIKSSLLAAAEEVVRYGGREQPDWFRDSFEVLMPINR